MANAVNALPFVYVFRRSPPSNTEPYFLISLNPVAGHAYTPIAHQSVLSDPSTIEEDPRFQVDIRDAKPVVAAEVTPFELTNRENGQDVAPGFRPDVPLA
jgi:hypothetical protein